MDRFGVLFICLGNICRSPLARAVFAQIAERDGLGDRLRIDSCGTGAWHAGGPADPRSVEVALRHGVPLPHVARQIRADDVHAFDLLIPMDRMNERDVIGMGAPRTRVRLMRSFDATINADRIPDVPDPYRGGADGFEDVFAMIERASEGLAAFVRDILRTR